tara:strand:+ start:2911 stop:3378 length:468 start_codon:yes stop_codon:yes gene_type:complete
MPILEPFTIADLAQAIVLGLGAVGSLLLVCWQSRCLIRCRIGTPTCYCFDCERAPPPIDDLEAGDKDKDIKDIKKKEKEILKKEDKILKNQSKKRSPSAPSKENIELMVTDMSRDSEEDLIPDLDRDPSPSPVPSTFSSAPSSVLDPVAPSSPAL